MNQNKKRIYFITRVGIWSAIATILYCVPIFHFSLIGFPIFLEIHLDEIPAFVAGFFYGPFSSVCVLLIKTLIKLPFTTSLCVGELADFIYSIFFIIPVVFIFKKFETKKSLILGLLIGTIFQLVSSFFLNIFVMFPFYENIFGIPVLEIAQAINPNIKDGTFSLGLIVVLPFNLIKDAIVLGITFVISIILLFTKKDKKISTE